MIFVETDVFTTKIQQLIDDDEYAKLQDRLIANPTAGAVIPHSGGFRKIRIPARGHGKRGGGRVIYYYLASDHVIYFVYAYAKADQEDLTAAEIKAFKQLLE